MYYLVFYVISAFHPIKFGQGINMWLFGCELFYKEILNHNESPLLQELEFVRHIRIIVAMS